MLGILLLLLLAEPDLVLTNGRIWTGDGFVQEIAISGNRIVAEKRGPRTKVIDLQGRFAMPGFNDAHIHFLGGSLRLTQVDLTGACTVEAMQQRVKAFADANPNKEWITGGGWEYYCFGKETLPKKEWLDAVVPDRPVFLSAYDGHTGWANSKALRIAEITRETKFSGFGEIVRDAQGEPAGALKEGAQGLVRRYIPRPTRAEKLAALEKGLKLAASLGITSFQNANGDAEELSLYEDLLRQGRLTVRVAMAMSVSPTTDLAALPRRADPMLTVRGVKFMLDGVVESHTAAMLAPYTDQPETSGEPAWKWEAYRDKVVAADKLGFQVWTHAIGDRAVRMALDAYALGRRDARHRVEHIETIHPQDVPRFAQLGVIASMEPIHADPGTVEVWSKAVGPERVKLAFPWQAFVKTGAHLAFSSDWPACIALDPMRGLHNAVNRMTTDGKPPGGWLPEHRVTVETALRGYTSEAAYAGFDEKIKGKLTPGMLADVIVLSQNPFAIAPERLHEIRVERTIFEGKVIWERGVLLH